MHVVTSASTEKKLQKAILRHTTVKYYFKREKHQLLSSHKYRPSFINLQFILKILALVGKFCPFLTDGGVTN